jgi:class 3 adenylate cyclase
MNQRANRTFVCSVLYLDIVDYSTMSVTAQLKLKQQLNSLLREALGEVAAVDRIVLEMTGGVMVSFLGRPSDALFVALDLRRKMAAAQGPDEPAERLRAGINLGPVRVVDEPAGQLKLVGDGINVAERVMNFADPDTILVSRSYYEVLCRQLPDFEPVFRFEGTRTDRQVREHSVFTVDLAGADSLRANLPPAALKMPVGPRRWPGVPGRLLAAGGRPVGGYDELRSGVLAAALLMALAIVGGAWSVRHDQASSPGAIDPLAAAPAAAGDAPVGSPPGSPATLAPPAPELRPAGGQRSAPAAASDPAPPATAPRLAEPAGRSVVTLMGHSEVAVTLAIGPWGEVYLDGQYQGVSPPLKKLNVAPGWHDIEIRNTTFPVFQQRFEAKSGIPLRIEHRY